jgi:stage V sporulation protein S
MNRFFSKLNLQDIKINPEGHRFPPDEDDGHGDVDQHVTEAVALEEPVVDQYAPAREVPSAPLVPAPSYDAPSEPAALPELEVEPAIFPDVHVDLVPSNGHTIEETSSTVEYVVEGGVAVSGEVLKVSARSRPSAVAGAIAGVVRESGRAEVQAIGAGATNQAVKAVAIARDYLSETGIDAICIPAFIDVTIENEDRTAIRLVVEPR